MQQASARAATDDNRRNASNSTAEPSRADAQGMTDSAFTDRSKLLDALIQTFRNADASLTRAAIAAHPACREWTERVLTNVLRDVADGGLVRRVSRSVYELTEAGRAYAAEIDAKS